MASNDDAVELTDLEVIQRFSLAVRGASAPRDAVIAALEADLAWLTGARRSRPSAAAEPEDDVEAKPARRAPARRAAASPRAAAPSRRSRQA